MTGRMHFEDRRATLSWIKNPQTGERLDQAVLTSFCAPASFTGEDVVEISCHGSASVIRAISDVLSQLGLCPAEPGAFSRQALENGKLDLAKIEATADLIDAQSAWRRKLCLRVLAGELDEKIDGWEAGVKALAAAVEATLDFAPEQGIDAFDSASFCAAADALIVDMERVLENATQTITDQVFTAILAGPTNAGKSTLFNRILGLDRCIVSNIHGTTRDLVDATIEIDGVPVRLFDSAGIRETDDAIEVEGVARAHAAIENADLVFWLNSADAQADAPHPGVIKVWTKADHAEAPDGSWLLIDSHSYRIAPIVDCIRSALKGQIGDATAGVVTRGRQRKEVQNAQCAMRRARDFIVEDRLEIAAVELRDSLRALLSIRCNSIDNVDVLDDVFSKHCIGK